MKKKPIPQRELAWKEEPFALIQETAPDFTADLERENQRAKDRAESDSKQLPMFGETV